MSKLISKKTFFMIFLSILSSLFGYLVSDKIIASFNKDISSVKMELTFNSAYLSQFEGVNQYITEIEKFANSILNYYEDKSFWENYSLQLRKNYSDKIISKIDEFDNHQQSFFNIISDFNPSIFPGQFSFINIRDIRSLILKNIYNDLIDFNFAKKYNYVQGIKVSNSFISFDGINDTVIYQLSSENKSLIDNFVQKFSIDLEDNISNNINDYFKDESKALYDYFNIKLLNNYELIMKNMDASNLTLIEIINEYKQFSLKKIDDSFENYSSYFRELLTRQNFIEINYSEVIQKELYSIENLKFVFAFIFLYLPLIKYFIFSKKFFNSLNRLKKNIIE